MTHIQIQNLEGAALESLARAVHEEYCHFLISQGYRYGNQTNGEAKTHRILVPYESLSAAEKEQNRLHALDIPNKLAYAGYQLVPAGAEEPTVVIPEAVVEDLSRREHIRWVKAKLAQPGNWRYGQPSDPQKFIDEDLVPWQSQSEEALQKIYTLQELTAMGRSSLPEDAREKDRILIRRIPNILARIGYTIQKIEPSA